jgi:hypothetical protein
VEKALVGCDADGGIFGADMSVFEGSVRFFDVRGLAGQKPSPLRIVNARALITTKEAKAIATFHHMDLLGKGKKIFSCIQMENCGADIHEKPRRVSGGNKTYSDGW